jgi:hypothetical protein
VHKFTRTNDFSGLAALSRNFFECLGAVIARSEGTKQSSELSASKDRRIAPSRRTLLAMTAKKKPTGSFRFVAP